MHNSKTVSSISMFARGLAVVLGGVLLCAGTIGCSESEKLVPSKAARSSVAKQRKTPSRYDPMRILAITELLEEQTVIGITWPEGSKRIRLAVEDDGSGRDGFAQYACLVLSGWGVSTGKQVIIEHSESQRVLGRADCPRAQLQQPDPQQIETLAAISSWQNACYRAEQIPDECRNVGRHAYNNVGAQPLREIDLGPIVGIALLEGGQRMSRIDSPDPRTAPEDGHYYIIGPGGVATYYFLRGVSEIAPR